MSEFSFIEMPYQQLLAYKNDGRIPSQHLLDDISGYELIIDSSEVDENFSAFIKVKRSETDLKTNLQRVEFLKEKGLWIK